MPSFSTLDQAPKSSAGPYQGEDSQLPQAPVYRKLLFLLASLLVIVPVWLPMYPQMVDLPQHAAQVSLLRSLHDPNFAYANLFHINWFTPYLFGYMLVYLFSSVFSIVTACKIVVSIAQVAIPLSTALLMKEMGADDYWALLTIPALYGFAYEWGFLNYIVAAPVGILFFWFSIRHAKKPTLKSTILLMFFVNALFFCHAMICGFFGLLSCGYILLETKSVRKTILRVAPMLAAVPTVVLWFVRTESHPAAKRPILWDLGWFNTVDGYLRVHAEWTNHAAPGFGRISGFFPRLLGVRPSLIYTVLGIIIFLLPIIAGARFSRRPKSWLPLVLCCLILLFAPHVVFGTDFTYQRFALFVLPCYCLVLLPPSVSSDVERYRRFQLIALLVALAWIGDVSARTLRYDAACKGFEQVISRTEPGQRALSMDFRRDDGVSIAPTFLHFGSWYAAQKNGVVDPSVAMMHPELVVYRPESVPKAVLWQFEWWPAIFQWDRFQGQQYRYFIARAPIDVGPYFFGKTSCPVSLRYSNNGWWLYERDAKCMQPAVIPPPGKDEDQSRH